jgi:hypothetical protein
MGRDEPTKVLAGTILRKSGHGGKPVGPGGKESMSSIRALKSEWFRKKPSTALSKTTTRTSGSASMASIRAANSWTMGGPMTLRGGLVKVMRQ